MSDPNVGQGQNDPNAAGATPDQSDAQTGQGGGGLGADQINAAKQQAQQQVDNTIGNLASKVPGGDQFAQQAKQQANSAIDNLSQQAQQQAGNAAGNLEQQAQQGGLGGLSDKLGGLLGGGGGQGGDQ